VAKVKESQESKVPRVSQGDNSRGTRLPAGKASDTSTFRGTSSKEPQTMEELLASQNYQFKGLKKGEIVEGVVTEITPKSLFIDIGGKTQGVILSKELETVKDFIKELKVGDKVKAYVGMPETDRGQILLSLRKYAQNFAWNRYADLLLSGEEVMVKGREVNKGGLIVDSPFGLQGFIPGSQISLTWRGKIDQLVNRNLKVKTIEVKPEQNRLVFSEKAISDAQKIASLGKTLQKVKEGEILEAEVTQIAPFGLFVKVKIEDQIIEGLIHISEVSWLKIDDLGKLYKVGDKFKVKLISTKEGKVQFSLKQLLPDPWEDLEKKYPLEKKIEGKVVRLASYGALIEIEPGIEGLLHVSKIPPEFQINEGDKVEVYIDSLDKKVRKISLGLVLKEKPLEYR